MPPKKRRHDSLSRRALVALGLTHREISEATGISDTQIGYFAAGSRRPGADARKRIENAYPTVTAAGWDQAVPSRVPVPPAPGPASTPADASRTRQQASRLGDMVDSLLQEIESSQGDTLERRSKLMASAAGTLARLGKLSGASSDISVAKVLKHPAWRRIEDTLVESLREWPDAARSVASALEDLAVES